MILLFYWIIFWAQVSAVYIALGDTDFVGEDPVLAAELTRRIARNRPPPEHLCVHERMKPSPREGKGTVPASRGVSSARKGPKVDGSSRGGLKGDSSSSRDPRRSGTARGDLKRSGRARSDLSRSGSARSDLKRSDSARSDLERSGRARSDLSRSGGARSDLRRRVNALGDFRRTLSSYWDLNQIVTHEGGEGHEQEYVAFEKDWNATNLYAMHLKVAEQAIYGLQQRITDCDKIIEQYLHNPLMRMAYMVRRLDMWLQEMYDYYDYTHGVWKNVRTSYNPLDLYRYENYGENPHLITNYRHILYYQMILKRYIDVTYTVEYLRKLHRAEVAKHQENQTEFKEGQGKEPLFYT